MTKMTLKSIRKQIHTTIKSTSINFLWFHSNTKQSNNQTIATDIQINKKFNVTFEQINKIKNSFYKQINESQTISTIQKIQSKDITKTYTV